MTDEQTILVPTETYFKAGVHIGTKFRTRYMSNFIYKTRNDGLVVLNIQEIDKRIKQAALFLAHYAPEEIIVVSRRENGWKPASLFARATGTQVFAGRYEPGVLTNPNLEGFTEAKVLLATDPWQDKNVIRDAKASGCVIVAMCDTNNECNNVDYAIPCNNKGRQALALTYFLLANEYSKARTGKEIQLKAEDFAAE